MKLSSEMLIPESVVRSEDGPKVSAASLKNSSNLTVLSREGLPPRRWVYPKQSVKTVASKSSSM